MHVKDGDEVGIGGTYGTHMSVDRSNTFIGSSLEQLAGNDLLNC
jgi:hypothetical protein